MWGYKRFFRRAMLETSDFLKDDCLKINCTVGVVISEIDCTRLHSIHVPESDIGDQFAMLLENEESSDVTFIVSGEKFYAHKLVLAARSTVFETKFSGWMEIDGCEILIRDMEPKVFKVLFSLFSSIILVVMLLRDVNFLHAARSQWIPPLAKLKNLNITYSLLEQLPPLGKLPSLESLQLLPMQKVKNVGVEFLGIEMSLSPSPSSVVAFPNLKSMQFYNMKEWEEWDYESRGEEDVIIMPGLSSLPIYYCEKLRMLPNYILQNTTLQELRISDCPIISKRYKEDYQPFVNRIRHSDV